MGVLGICMAISAVLDVFFPTAGCLLGCLWWFSHQRAWGLDGVYKFHGHLTEWRILRDRYWAKIIFLSVINLHLFTLNYCIFGMMSKILSFLPVFFLIITGGDDNLVKVWDYMEGVVTHVGKAHGGSITSIKLCSNSSTLISTSADGAIILWRFPHSPTS